MEEIPTLILLLLILALGDASKGRILSAGPNMELQTSSPNGAFLFNGVDRFGDLEVSKVITLTGYTFFSMYLRGFFLHDYRCFWLDISIATNDDRRIEFQRCK